MSPRARGLLGANYKKILYFDGCSGSSLGVGLTANAYIPAFSVYECPHCKTHVIKGDWASEFRGSSSVYSPYILPCSGQITTIKSGSHLRHKWSYYTDGKSGEGNPRWIAKCPVCKKLFWMEYAELVGIRDNGQKKILGPSEKELFAIFRKTVGQGKGTVRSPTGVVDCE